MSDLAPVAPDDSWHLEVQVRERDGRTKEYSMVAVPENKRKRTINLATIWRSDNDTEQAILDLLRKLAGVNWSGQKKAGQ